MAQILLQILHETNSSLLRFSSQLDCSLAILDHLLSWMFKVHIFKVHGVDTVTVKQISNTQGCVDDKRRWGVLMVQLCVRQPERKFKVGTSQER